MRLTRIRAADFRNLTFADVSTDAPRVFLLGDNGQGKTNLLEAAALVSSFRSFRTTDIAPLVRSGCTEARLRLDALRLIAEGPGADDEPDPLIVFEVSATHKEAPVERP